MRSHTPALLALTLMGGLAMSSLALAQTGTRALPVSPPGSEDVTNPGATDSMHGLRTGPNSVTTGAGPSAASTLPRP
jgi:hypothetical protein